MPENHSTAEDHIAANSPFARDSRKTSNPLAAKEYQFTDEQREALENLPYMMAVYQTINGKTVTVLVSNQLCEAFHMDRAQIKESLDTSMFGFVHPEDVPRISYAGTMYAKRKAPYSVQYRVKLPGMEYYHVYHCVGKRRIMPDGTALAFFLYTDISEQDAEAEKAKRDFAAFEKGLAFRDSLTGLGNMKYLNTFGMEEVNKLRQAGRPVCLVYSNVKGMKAYNGRYGISAGDTLLKNIAALLGRHFPDALAVRLYGGDHFLVLSDAEGVTDKLDAIESEYAPLSHSGRFALSFGIYYANADQDDITTMSERSRFAMTQATPGSYSVYDSEKDAAYWNEQYVLNCFDEAMEKRWIRVYYQPVYNLHTGKLESMEALSRWIDPEKGFLSPAQFIPTLEKNHLTWKLDYYVL